MVLLGCSRELGLTNQCRNTWFLLAHTGAVKADPGKTDRRELRNEGTSVLIITPSKREDPGTCKTLLSKPDPDKEDQTFILLSPIHPSMLKNFTNRSGGTLHTQDLT